MSLQEYLLRETAKHIDGRRFTGISVETIKRESFLAGIKFALEYDEHQAKETEEETIDELPF